MVEILYEGCLFISYTVSYGVTHGCFVMFHHTPDARVMNPPGHFVCRSQLKRYASLLGDEYKILMRTICPRACSAYLTPDQAAFIKQQRQLNVGVTHYDVPPFGMRNIRNEYEGLSADYTGLVAWQLNLPVNVKVFSSSEEAWQALARGDIDLIPSVAAFPDNETFAFSLPYASDKPVLGLNDSDTAALAEDLHDTDVAMPRDYLPLSQAKATLP
jgi:two-component system sensor histidine kinase EvgS